MRTESWLPEMLVLAQPVPSMGTKFDAVSLFAAVGVAPPQAANRSVPAEAERTKGHIWHVLEHSQREHGLVGDHVLEGGARSFRGVGGRRR